MNPTPIQEVYVCLSKDHDGNEGVPAVTIGGKAVPLIAFSKERLDQLIPVARKIAHEENIKISLVKFTTRETIEEFGFLYKP